MENPEKTEVGLPLIGEKAPDFEAVTTQGTLRLSDFEGSWLVMFSQYTANCKKETHSFLA